MGGGILRAQFQGINISSIPGDIKGDVHVNACDYPSITFYISNTLYWNPQNPDQYSYRYYFYRNNNLVHIYPSPNDNPTSLPTINSDQAGITITNGLWRVDCQVLGTNAVVTSNELDVLFLGDEGEYSSSKIKYRMVSGDFDNDGRIDDLAGFYDYENNLTSLHVWKGLNNQFDFLGTNGWWSSQNFDAIKASGSVICGDFDHDGFLDDIAVMYNYDGSLMRILTWFGDANTQTFDYQGSWYTSNQWDQSKARYMVTVGDFDQDGYIDDIAAFYDHPGFRTKAQIWFTNPNQTAFSSQGTWYDSGQGNFDAQKIRGRVVTGDFDNDGFYDDIAAMYEYPNAQAKIFVWSSNGLTLSSPMTFYNSGTGNYDASKSTFTMTSVDCDDDGFQDDIVAFYDDGNVATRAFSFLSNSASFSISTAYNSGPGNFSFSSIQGKVVSGDFDGDGAIDDISTMYEVSSTSVRNFTFRNNNCSLVPRNWWSICDRRKSNFQPLDNTDVSFHLETYPNPVNDILTIKVPHELNNCKVSLLSSDGLVVKEFIIFGFENQIDLSQLPSGMYFLLTNGLFNPRRIIKV